jgi:hypothetical protein
MTEDSEVWVLKIKPRPDAVPAVNRMRHVLKALVRSYRMSVVSVSGEQVTRLLIVEAGTPVRVRRTGERVWRDHTTRVMLGFSKAEGGSGKRGRLIFRHGNWLIEVERARVSLLTEGGAAGPLPADRPSAGEPVQRVG